MSRYDELLAQKKAIEAELEQARKQEIGESIASIRALIEKFGLTEADLFSKAPTEQKAVQPKYRNPETGETWAGRGREPMWMKGRDREEFAIAPPAQDSDTAQAPEPENVAAPAAPAAEESAPEPAKARAWVNGSYVGAESTAHHDNNPFI